MLWPQVWYGIRFMLPIIPLMQFFAILGVYKTLKWMFPNQVRLQTSPHFAILFTLLLIPQVVGIKKLQAKKENDHPKNWNNYFKMAEWTKNNLPDAKACK